MAARFREYTVTMTGAWVEVAPAQIGRLRLILADAAGTGGCLWSTKSAPATNEGVPFGVSNKIDFQAPSTPDNAIYVKGANGTVVTVVVAS